MADRFESEEKAPTRYPVFSSELWRGAALTPGRVPHHIIRQLMSESLCSGGLVLVSGATGVGKTTTTSSAVVSRLHSFGGGVAWAIEDPSEYDMEGQHGDRHGICWQKSVTQGGFAQAMRNVMRCYPAGAYGILMVGEVRDKETADQCIRAAMNGLLVIATIHSNSIIGTIDRLIGMSSERDRGVARQILSMSLRLIVHQARRPGEQSKIVFRSLWVNQDSQVSSAIRMVMPQHSKNRSSISPTKFGWVPPPMLMKPIKRQKGYLLFEVAMAGVAAAGIIAGLAFYLKADSDSKVANLYGQWMAAYVNGVASFMAQQGTTAPAFASEQVRTGSSQLPVVDHSRLMRPCSRAVCQRTSIPPRSVWPHQR